MSPNSINNDLDQNNGSYDNWNLIWEKYNKNIEFYSQFIRDRNFKSIYQFWQKAYAKDLISIISGRNYETFLELGAGKGTTSMYLMDAGYKNITLVDLSIEGQKLAMKLFEHYGLNKPNYIIADVEHTLLESSKYDCIYNIGLLEHFEDPTATLAEAYRLLRDNGLIFMPIVPKLPYKKSLLSRLFFNQISIIKFVVKKLIRKESSISYTMVRTKYGRKFYQEICKNLGYKNIRCVPYNPYWKVNDNEDFERLVTIPLYDFYYRLFKIKKTISLQTSSLTEMCYLLVAEK
jgi:ubiquinone/menaquinone biosynthesis C-methylase UbiE